MSGHNKWSTIKHKKGAADAKRGKVFTRITKEIIIAAREGGGDPDSNPRLRTAMMSAREANMPNVNIDKAIKRGTGEIVEGGIPEEAIYEGYGHAGVAIIVDVVTDNRNRTVAELRHCFSKYGGNLAESGAVAWNFEQKGWIAVPADREEDEFMMLALDCGADDVQLEDESFNIYTAPAELHSVAGSLEKQGFKIERCELTYLPKNTVNADSVAEKLFKLIDMLEDLDDVQKVYANFEISDEVLERLA